MNNSKRFGRFFAVCLMSVLVLVAFSLPARAQFDSFGQPRTAYLATPQMIIGTGGQVTNAPVDIRCFKGIVNVDLFCVTNAAGQTMTATLEYSTDSTNWTALSNYALATATSINYTNGFYGTNLVRTNTWLLPGTVTTPTAGTAGWATPYLLAAPFTNTGAITCSVAGVYSVGFNADDVGRYLHVYWTPGGTTTNCAVGAIVTGRALYVP